MSDLDRRALRDAFGSFMTGVTIVTTKDSAGNRVGFTANSFTSVSLDPPMLLVCPGKKLSSFADFESCDRFAVSILAEGQEDVSNTFAGYQGDRFAEIEWEEDASGIPLISGAVVQFSCRTAQTVPAGDHLILIGEVMAFNHAGGRGLGYAEGGYFSLGLERKAAGAARGEARTNVGAIVAKGDTVLLKKTDKGWDLPCCRLSDRGRVREEIINHLAEAGLSVTLGKAYSVYDDKNLAANFTFFLADTEQDSAEALGEFIPIERLQTLSFVSSGMNSMMRRYAYEAGTGNFAFYVGDETAGIEQS